MLVPPNRDLHITILILPQLEKYSSCTRFGIRSREWGGKHNGYTGVHDGLSFMILSIKWVDGVDSYEERTEGKKMKLRPRTPGVDDAEEMEPSQNRHHLESNGHGEMGGVVRESFERGGPAPLDNELGDMKGLGRNWWKGKCKMKETTKSKEQLAPESEAQENKEPLAVQPAEHLNGHEDIENYDGDDSASIAAKSPPRPLRERVADMFKREDF